VTVACSEAVGASSVGVRSGVRESDADSDTEKVGLLDKEVDTLVEREMDKHREGVPESAVVDDTLAVELVDKHFVGVEEICCVVVCVSLTVGETLIEAESHPESDGEREGETLPLEDAVEEFEARMLPLCLLEDERESVTDRDRLAEREGELAGERESDAQAEVDRERETLRDNEK
jgi:hypothetical protein